MIARSLVAILAVGAALAGPVAANDGLSQLQRSAAWTLKNYGYEDVDVTTLSTAQLAQIQHIANNSSQGAGNIRGSIGAIVRGGLGDFLKRL
ncbi:hypothetical protein C8N43_2162 [Litoreibacter ponti]|uniref:Small secreted protein n=1 Tax=Litoreibacter ponti TaxID=1510457 RepID=A0A2T6BN70_9RHOB|nr:hypothetical protein [Litoreibacter ponti]PTX57492.1 hypothetical protein C8N43_2162 [Litoreibacter ponti]